MLIYVACTLNGLSVPDADVLINMAKLLGVSANQFLVSKRNDQKIIENDKDEDNEENDREVWETLINAAAYDFPNVRQLKADIRTILDSDMEDAQIVRNNSGDPYEKVLCLGTEGTHVEEIA